MIIRDSEKLAILAGKMKDPENFLIGRMFICKDIQALAVAIRAYWLLFDTFSIELPPNHNPIWDKAHALVHYVNTTPDCSNLNVGEFLTTPRGMVQDYDFTPPSDECRRQWKEWRAKNGLSHVGTRHVGTKPSQKVSRFSQALPLHWNRASA